MLLRAHRAALGTRRLLGLETGANFISSISKMEEYFNKVVAVQFKLASRENR